MWMGLLFESTSIPLLKMALPAWPPAIGRPGHAFVGVSTGFSLITRVALPVFCDPVVTPPVLHVGSLDDKVISK